MNNSVFNVNSNAPSFRGDFEFLSNFYESPLRINGIRYRNAEAAFQSFKLLDKEQRKQFSNLSGAEAKALGQKIPLRPDWDDIKNDVMEGVVHIKFKQNPELKEKLVNIPGQIHEINDWGDTYWGISNGQGEDHMGKILTKLKNAFVDEKAQEILNEFDGASNTNKTPSDKKTLAFTGHRPQGKLGPNFNYNTKNEYWSAVREATKKYIKDNDIRKVYSGGALGYDQVAMEASLELKKEGYDLEVIAALPCQNHGSAWPEYSQKYYQTLFNQCDKVVTVTDAPYQKRFMQVRNEYMVDNADEVLAFFDGSPGGTKNCVDYAIKHGKPVTVISPQNIIAQVNQARTNRLSNQLSTTQQSGANLASDMEANAPQNVDEVKTYE